MNTFLRKARCLHIMDKSKQYQISVAYCFMENQWLGQMTDADGEILYESMADDPIVAADGIISIWQDDVDGLIEEEDIVLELDPMNKGTIVDLDEILSDPIFLKELGEDLENGHN